MAVTKTFTAPDGYTIVAIAIANERVNSAIEAHSRVAGYDATRDGTTQAAKTAKAMEGMGLNIDSMINNYDAQVAAANQAAAGKKTLVMS